MIDRGIRLRQLAYFVEAARSGSLLKASEMLHVSQPAISAGLHDLERTLGARLLACETAVRLAGLDPGAVQACVDELPGLQEILAEEKAAEVVLYV